MKIDKLDNPTWYALSETHKNFAVDYQGIKFYHPDYCPFGGFINANQTKTGIEKYASLVDSFFVVGDRPDFNDKVRLDKVLVCNQMVLRERISMGVDEHIIELRTKTHKTDLLALVNLVQPGYFRDRTPELGNYYGIYKEDKLIAVTGERMKMNGYTELSAIVTHPAHTGRGYAKQLITYVSNNAFNQDQIPFLHVANTNIGAIALYEKLGFRTRREMNFWHFVANDNR